MREKLKKSKTGNFSHKLQEANKIDNSRDGRWSRIQISQTNSSYFLFQFIDSINMIIKISLQWTFSWNHQEDNKNYKPGRNHTHKHNLCPSYFQTIDYPINHDLSQLITSCQRKLLYDSMHSTWTTEIHDMKYSNKTILTKSYNCYQVHNNQELK